MTKRINRWKDIRRVFVCVVTHASGCVVMYEYACLQFREQNKLYFNTVRFVFILQGVGN